LELKKKGTRQYRKFSTGKISNLYSLLLIIRANKSRRVKWEGKVACQGKKTDA
jgi:hypothetical protein